MLAIKPRKRTINQSAQARMSKHKRPHLDADLKDIRRLVVIDADEGRFFVFKGKVVISTPIVSEKTLDWARTQYPQNGAFFTYQEGFNPCKKSPSKSRSNRRKKAKSPKEGIVVCTQGGQGEVFPIKATIRQERQAVLAAVNQAFDRLEGIAQKPEVKKPITVPAPKAKQAKTDDEVEDWMKPAFSGQKLKFSGGKK